MAKPLLDKVKLDDEHFTPKTHWFATKDERATCVFCGVARADIGSLPCKLPPESDR